LSLIVDWRDSKGEPEIHVGLPAGGWGYKGKARLHWRVEVPEGGIDLSELRFNPADSGDGTGERLVDLLYEVDEVDPKE
jgi:hypothetical protein